MKNEKTFSKETLSERGKHYVITLVYMTIDFNLIKSYEKTTASIIFIRWYCMFLLTCIGGLNLFILSILIGYIPVGYCYCIFLQKAIIIYCRECALYWNINCQWKQLVHQSRFKLIDQTIIQTNRECSLQDQSDVSVEYITFHFTVLCKNCTKSEIFCCNSTQWLFTFLNEDFTREN